MASIINAGTTTATAINMVTDTTGELVIQTSGVNAISISSSQVVSLTNALLPASGGTGITSLGTGVATFLGTPSSANLAAAVTGETGSGALVFGTSPTLASPALTGVPTAPTATAGTDTTQIATTAFVTAATGTLGTMSTQNANNVAITGGTITGITDLAVAAGGTGRSTLTANNVILGNGTSAVNFVAPSTSGLALRSNGTTFTMQKLGLGMTGEIWRNVAGSRASGTTYTNSNTYPIAVSAGGDFANGGPSINVTVNGVSTMVFNWQFNGAGARSGAFAIVPAGATYRLDFNGSGISIWTELS
jgi:hypothetical protein